LERRVVGDRSGLDSRGQHRAELSTGGKTALLSENRPDAKHFVVWDLPSGSEVFRLAPPSGMRFGRCTLSPDGKRLAVIAYEEGPKGAQSLRVYELPNGRMWTLGATEFNVYNVQFSADGNRIVLDQVGTTPQTRDHTLALF